MARGLGGPGGPGKRLAFFFRHGLLHPESASQAPAVQVRRTAEDQTIKIFESNLGRLLEVLPPTMLDSDK